MLKHMAAHNASRAFAVAASALQPESEIILAVEPVPALAILWIASSPGSLN